MWNDEFDKVPERFDLFIKELIWDQIQQYLCENEIDFIRRKVGNALIQENEDLLSELKALLHILHSYRKDREIYSGKRECLRSSIETNTNLRSSRILSSVNGKVDTQSLNINSIGVDSLKNNLNFFNIDKIVTKLREAIFSEKTIILEDIEFIRNILEEETSSTRE
jgi:hypothetical protein